MELLKANNSGDFSIQNYPGAKKDKKVTIGDGIHRIERACFFNNPYIEEIVIGPDVLQLCDWCFYECLNVKTIRFTRTSDIETSYDLSDTMFGSSSSTNKPKEITVIVPKGTLSEYQKVFEREKPDQTITFNLIEE